MRRTAGVFLIGIVALGCSRRDQPIMAHDKPVDHWLSEITSADPKARKKAVTALGHVGPRHSEAVPAVIVALKDRDVSVRNEAVLALLHVGPDARDAIPALNEALQDNDATVRKNAAKAVERINGKK
jgi:HEAT repeat protein